MACSTTRFGGSLSGNFGLENVFGLFNDCAKLAILRLGKLTFLLRCCGGLVNFRDNQEMALRR